jgi:Uma2 family endonuclease
MKPNSDQLADDHSRETSRLVERYYSVREIAELWRLSPDFVRRLFEKEPDVMIFEAEKSSRHKRRRYRTLRIPEHVLERVLRKRSQV